MSIQTFSFAAVALATLAATSGNAAVQVFTDRAAFEAAANSTTFNSFNGAAAPLAPNSFGNPVAPGITVDVIGGVGETGDIPGKTGDGFFFVDVDNSSKTSGDGRDVRFNFSAFGFGITDLIDDEGSDNRAQEIGITFAGTSFLLSDILGLTTSSNGEAVPSTSIGPLPFIGFLSDSLQDGFTFTHGDNLVAAGVDGANEDFLLGGLILADAAPVPLPAGLPMLLAALTGFAALRRRAQ